MMHGSCERRSRATWHGGTLNPDYYEYGLAPRDPEAEEAPRFGIRAAPPMVAGLLLLAFGVFH